MQIKFFDFEQAFKYLEAPSVDYQTRMNARAWKAYRKSEEWKGDEMPDLPFNGLVETPLIHLPSPLKSFETEIQRNGKYYFVRFFLVPAAGFEKACFQDLEHSLKEEYGKKWLSLGRYNEGHILNEHEIANLVVTPCSSDSSWGRGQILGLFMGTAGAAPKIFSNISNFKKEMREFESAANHLTNAVFENGVSLSAIAPNSGEERILRYKYKPFSAVLFNVSE